MTAAEMILCLTQWRESGWLRRLDVALPRFIVEQVPHAPASLLLAAGLLAQLEGRGHSCLPLSALTPEAADLLAWPPEAQTALEVVWRRLVSGAGSLEALVQAWPAEVVQQEPVHDAGRSPLVLCRGRLYLRRYWRYERRVALQIRARTLADPRGDSEHEGQGEGVGVDVERARALAGSLVPAEGAVRHIVAG